MRIEDFMDDSALHAMLDASRAKLKGDLYPSHSISGGTIGHPCDAFISLTLRGFPDNYVPPEITRTFEAGHAFERIVLADLKSAGVRVSDRRADGKQHEFTDYEGHVKVKLDGFIEQPDGTLVILEIKSMNKKSFEAFMKKGLREAHPKYRAQVMLEMGLSRAKRAVVLAICKDDSRYWSEVVEFDEFEFAAQKQRIDIIITNRAKRISKTPGFFACKFCSKSEACWEGKTHGPLVAKSCMQCAYSMPDVGRTWFCSKKDARADALCPDFTPHTPMEKS